MNAFRSLAPHVLAFAKGRLIACAHFCMREIWGASWTFYSVWLQSEQIPVDVNVVIRDLVAVVTAIGKTSSDIMSLFWPTLTAEVLSTSLSHVVAAFHFILLPSSFVKCLPKPSPTQSAPSLPHPIESPFDALLTAWKPESRNLDQMTHLIEATCRGTSTEALRKTQALALLTMDLLSRANWSSWENCSQTEFHRFEPAQAEAKENGYAVSFVSLLFQCLRGMGDLPTGEVEVRKM